MQPTYEGLKPIKDLAFVNSKFDLQPTYEGLKPVGGRFCGIEYENLQPTYEGLKPTVGERVPPLALEFAAYLRGIETRSQGM